MKGQFILVATIFLAATLLTISATINNFETSQIVPSEAENSPNYLSEQITKFNQEIEDNPYNRNQTLSMIEMSSYVYEDNNFESGCLEIILLKHGSKHEFNC